MQLVKLYLWKSKFRYWMAKTMRKTKIWSIFSMKTRNMKLSMKTQRRRYQSWSHYWTNRRKKFRNWVLNMSSEMLLTLASSKNSLRNNYLSSLLSFLMNANAISVPRLSSLRKITRILWWKLKVVRRPNLILNLLSRSLLYHKNFLLVSPLMSHLQPYKIYNNKSKIRIHSFRHSL
jgi:hypothetical protein